MVSICIDASTGINLPLQRTSFGIVWSRVFVIINRMRLELGAGVIIRFIQQNEEGCRIPLEVRLIAQLK